MNKDFDEFVDFLNAEMDDAFWDDFTNSVIDSLDCSDDEVLTPNKERVMIVTVANKIALTYLRKYHEWING